MGRGAGGGGLRVEGLAFRVVGFSGQNSSGRTQKSSDPKAPPKPHKNYPRAKPSLVELPRPRAVHSLRFLGGGRGFGFRVWGSGFRERGWRGSRV